jgi:tetrahydromethanopterin S-methyltransferase subunit G
MVVKVQDRVDELERRLEDRIEGIRNAVESKLDNANTRVDNANTRVFIYSLITAVAMFVAGLLFGAFLTLLLGG